VSIFVLRHVGAKKRRQEGERANQVATTFAYAYIWKGVGCGVAKW